MFIPLFTLVFFVILALCVLFIIKIITLIKVIHEKKLEIDDLDARLYSELRELQFKSKNISKYSTKMLKQKNSILGEFFSSLFISLLPFKKVKSLLLIHKLAKRVL